MDDAYLLREHFILDKEARVVFSGLTVDDSRLGAEMGHGVLHTCRVLIGLPRLIFGDLILHETEGINLNA